MIKGRAHGAAFFCVRSGSAILAPRAAYEVGQPAELELGGGLKTHSDWRGRV
jgi:hypothetical protein